MTTREDAIRLAKEAGLGFFKQFDSDATSVDALERFYILAQNEAYRKAAKECLDRHVNGNFMYDTRYDCTNAILALVKEI